MTNRLYSKKKTYHKFSIIKVKVIKKRALIAKRVGEST
jgi:hypothetical protein